MRGGKVKEKVAPRTTDLITYCAGTVLNVKTRAGYSRLLHPRLAATADVK